MDSLSLHRSSGPRSAASGGESGRAAVKTSSSALTASSTGDGGFFHNHTNYHSGGSHGRPPASSSSSERRLSGAWDRPQHPAIQAMAASSVGTGAGSGSGAGSRGGSIDIVRVSVDDHSTSGTSQHLWAEPDTDDSSADEATPTYRALDQRGLSKTSGSRSKGSKGFFRSLVRKFTKTNKRYGYLPDSAEEKDRNVLQHQIIYDVFEGRLHLAPLGRPKRVLDVGTGPGHWALRNTASAVLGVDINEIHPPYSVPNCHFHIMDVSQEWHFEYAFDFIHVRMLGDFAHKARLVKTIYDNLSPGGWVEFTEWIVQLQSPDHSLDGSAFQKWNMHLKQGLRNLGSSLYYPNEYRSLLKKTGFERITETRNGALTNPCYPGRRLQKTGSMMTSNWNAILEPLSMPVFTNALGWTEDQTRTLLNDVRKELGDTRFHSYMPLITICARKPSDGASSTSASVSSIYRYHPPGTSLTTSSSTSQSEVQSIDHHLKAQPQQQHSNLH